MIEMKTGENAPLRDEVMRLLTEQAAASGHPFNKTILTFGARDGDRVVGGLIARITLNWMFVELLAVAPEARGQGHGQALMQQAEAEARQRGLTGIWLDTYTFQAPDFYAGLGFTEFGRVEDYPEGGARVFFRKRLD